MFESIKREFDDEISEEHRLAFINLDAIGKARLTVETGPSDIQLTCWTSVAVTSSPSGQNLHMATCYHGTHTNYVTNGPRC